MFTFFFFNDTATTEIYTLSLHDALPIWAARKAPRTARRPVSTCRPRFKTRSEEHTSELQSQSNLVCRLLLEKKNSPSARLPDFSLSPKYKSPLMRPASRQRQPRSSTDPC